MRIPLLILAFLISTLSFSQDELSKNIIFGKILKENRLDTITGTVSISKGDYVVEKEFRDQFHLLINSGGGEYLIVVRFGDRVFTEYLSLESTGTIIVYNILENPFSLDRFDFSDVITISPGVYDLFKRKDAIYINF